MQSLIFQSIQLNIIDHNSKRWLSASDIARALNYAREDAVSRIYERNSDEFSGDMTETVKLTVSGNLQKEVRIFSLRGAHLIAMFSRTKVAKEFRKWVLDVLDKETDQSVPVTKTKALPSPLSTEQQSVIKELVKSRVTALPPSKQAKAAITCWSALKSKFGCSYKLIESEQFSDAVSLVARLTLEGEFLGKETKHLPNLSYPIETLVSRRAGMLTVCNNKHAWLDITLHDLRDIHGDETPLEQLLGELNKAGYDIEGCWWELRTYRNKVRELANLAAGMNRAIEEPHRYAVTTNRDSL